MNIALKDAEDKLLELVAKAEAGEEIVLTRDGHPVAKMVATLKPARRSPLGAFAHIPFYMADDFDDLGPEWDEYTK